jgi:methionyl aminopeptidase
MYDKTSQEIQAMREGGKIIAAIFRDLKKHVVAGVSERELSDWVENEIKSYGAVPTYKTAEVNFPASICISTNSQVVHSIPTDYVLQKGDVIGFDLVITFNGMKTDSAFTVVVDEVPSGDKQRLLEFTEKSLYAGINTITGPVKTGNISAAIESVLKAGKLGIVRELVGHGIGHNMHEAPDVPNYGHAGSGVLLRPGMTIAIEPMATLGGEKIYVADDQWTICTADNSLAAHFEHTVLVTEDGCEILTTL